MASPPPCTTRNRTLICFRVLQHIVELFLRDPEDGHFQFIVQLVFIGNGKLKTYLQLAGHADAVCKIFQARL